MNPSNQTSLARLVFIPLSIGLMFYPSANYSVLLDGAESVYSGFPFPWNSQGLVSSLSKDVYILPFIIDLVVYLIFGYFVVKYAASIFSKTKRNFRTSIFVFTWFYGGISLALIFLDMFIVNELSYHLWFNQEFEIISIHLGGNLS